jgi:hypothetical protein
MEGQGNGSGGQSLYSHHGNPGWGGGTPIHVDLWWTKLYWDMFFSEYFCFSLWVSFHYSYPPQMPHNLSSGRHMKTRTEAKYELVRVMYRVTYHPLKDRSGETWMGNCGLGMGYHYQTEFMHYSYWFSLNPHPLNSCVTHLFCAQFLLMP